MTDEWELPDTVQSQSIERLGGGFSWESAVYDVTVKMVYLSQRDSKAVFFNVVLVNAAGKELKESMCIKSGNDKGNKTFYTGKDGINRPLPGYSTAHSLCIAATGESLAKCMRTAETKVVQIYDFDSRKDVAAERPVLMNLVNKPIKAAISQVKEDKKKKDPATGIWNAVPGQTRMLNECQFFGNMEGKTAEEIAENKPAEFFNKWSEKNTGQVIDKSTKDGDKPEAASAAAIMGGNTAAPVTGAPAQAAPLFPS